MTRRSLLLLAGNLVYRVMREHIRIYRAVRQFRSVQRLPNPDFRDVWLAARHVVHTIGYSDRWFWGGEFEYASRVSFDIKQRTGNRILLMILFPELC